ncbi:MAG: methylase involved in ubiquinone/menaquinone biosynthesis [Mycobacterium sp.]|jgi:SAM-dependent methyltransferase|nr:methylase involved in ubiquinone/menaquinone biosynthesis [Mycobacterium sp.]
MLGGVPPRLNLFTNRLRANSFGGAARSYDTHRPRYPDQMIDDLVALDARRVLDVGAGTGIASQQLAERGADVLAVEPDARMAAVAQEKGVPTEIDTFERWDPAGRMFDLVVFGASFHWVDPAIALPKVRELLRDGGNLALLWNRLIPTRPTHDDFAAIYSDYMDADTPMDGNPDDLVAVLTAAGYTVTQHTYPRSVHYSREQWLDLVFTHSNHLTLDADKAAGLRSKLADRIGPEGVAVGGDALAILAAPA